MKAITRPTRTELAPVRVKDVYRCEELDQLLARLSLMKVKGKGGQPWVCYCVKDTVNNQPVYVVPNSICFLRSVKGSFFVLSYVYVRHIVSCSNNVFTCLLKFQF